MISLRTLGPADVQVDGRPAPAELLWRKNLALLVYLARSPRRTRSREHLMGLLWGDRPASSARHSLREAIRAIRGACGEEALSAEGDNLTLREGLVRLDIEQLEDACRRGAWREATALAEGDFLEGFGVGDAAAFEDWLAAERQRVRAQLVGALVHEAADLSRHGDPRGAAAQARRALMLEPLSAAATGALMTACALAGERAEALMVFDMYAKSFEAATGSQPDASIVQLAERVRRERAGRVTAQPQRGAESRRAPLVGRAAVLARLEDMRQAAAGSPALIMIGGDPGSGRTRLAEEVATRARLEGAAIVRVRGTPADREQPWSGTFALARGGLLEAPGSGGATGAALATFAERIEAWADRYAGARGLSGLPPGDALTDIVRAAAAEQPLMLVADDAHWLDAETLAQFERLLRDCAGLPLCIVITATDDPQRSELDQLRTRAGRDLAGGSVKLGSLDDAAIRELCRWAMPAWNAPALERLARRIRADSAGLPLLAVELLHAVALGMDLEASSGAWPAPQRTLDQTMPGDLPEAIVAAIRIGFRRLSPQAQLAVAALAVLGDDSTERALARATGLDPAALADALHEAEWQRWLVADGRGYAFVARITRAVVANDMVTAGQRRRFQESAKPLPLEALGGHQGTDLPPGMRPLKM